MQNKRKFDVVCLSGGGTKAIGQLGVLNYYYENGQLDLGPNGAKDFPGTSAGSIINLLLIVGYIPIEIFKEVYNINNFFIGDPFGAENIPTTSTASSSSISSLSNIWELISNYGFLSIEIPMSIVEKMIIRKLGQIPTLWELYKMTGKRLISPAVNISKKPCPVLVYITPESHPHMRCIDVCKLSSKLPLIFQRVQYNGDYYEDGGLGDNFPIEAVDIRGKNVLGVTVVGSDMGDSYLPFISYLYRVIMFPINTNTHLRSRNLGENVTLISLNFDDVPVIELNIGHNRKMGMFMRGYKEAEREEKKEKLYIRDWDWDLSEKVVISGWDIDIKSWGC